MDHPAKRIFSVLPEKNRKESSRVVLLWGFGDFGFDHRKKQNNLKWNKNTSFVCLIPSRHVHMVQQPWWHISHGFSARIELKMLRLYYWLSLLHSCRETLLNGEICLFLGGQKQKTKVRSKIKEMNTQVTLATCLLTCFLIVARVGPACF